MGNDVDIRRTLRRTEALLYTASGSLRVDQLENRLVRACTAEEQWNERMFRLGDWQAGRKVVRARQLLRHVQEIIATHREWQKQLGYS